MPSLDEVKSQLRQAGVTTTDHMRAVGELPRILWEDERIERMIDGAYHKAGGILIATNRRLLFVAKGLLGRFQTEDFAYGRITSIYGDINLRFGTIVVLAAGNASHIEQVNKAKAEEFVRHVRARIAALAEQPRAPTPPQVPSMDTITQLERLSKLRDQGILSEDEFNQQKKKILGF